ncbi:MAG: choice-of-anchor D domain-containing protein [Candidatus Neomarinimicrobiota bacterium]
MKLKTLRFIALCMLFSLLPVTLIIAGNSASFDLDENLNELLGSLKATNINSAEYFLDDNDPGPGSATALTVSIVDGKAVINSVVQLNSLLDGIHQIYLRLHDATTGWGPARGTQFIVTHGTGINYQITQAEYYIDTDPGEGAGTALTISSAGAEVTVSGNFSADGYENGEHRLFVRFYNSETGWGPARGTKFYKTPAKETFNIAGAEYYIDTDPGNGAGTTIAAPVDGVYDETEEEFSISPSLPAVGQHKIYMRMRDNLGHWGPARAVNFTVTDNAETNPTIAAAEYFIDTDPGNGSGTVIPAPADGTYDEATEEFEVNYSVGSLSLGRHIVYIRTRDSRGHWGPARGTIFIISEDAQPVISAAEYFFDADPGDGNGTPFPAKDGAYNTTEEAGELNLSIPATGLAVGNHKVYVRFMNSRGDWSAKKYADFSIVVKPTIEVSVTAIDFGTVFIGDSAKEEFVIRNKGDANLTISGITAPTGYKTSFVTSQGTVAPGDTLLVTVTFKPTAETNYNGNLVISNNDAQKNIALTGRGSRVPISKITATPASPYNFGEVDLFADVSKSVQVKITNTGTKKLWISSITSSDPVVFSHDFSSLTDSIAINAYITFHITFTPKDTINYSEHFTIVNNSPTSDYEYEVSGKGIGTYAPHIVLLADTLAFGTVQTGFSSTKILRIANTGTIDLNISSISSSNGDFRTNLSASNNVVTPGDTNEVNVTFQPASAVTYDETLSIYSSDTPNSPSTVRVLGIGSATPVPDIQVSANSLSFGNIKLSASAVTRSFTISNKGSANLNITSIASDNLVFTTNITGSRVLAPNANLIVQTTFRPTESIVYNARLIIQSDDPDDADLSVSLYGSSVFPEIFVLNSNLNYGNIAVNTASDLAVTIENNGTDTLKVTGFQKSSEIAGVIAITPLTYNIQPAQSKNFKFTFTPIEPILYSGEVIILNNDVPETVKVSGQGIDNIPPSITYDPSILAATPVNENTQIPIQAGISDNNMIDWARLFYRQGGKTTYDSLSMTKNGSNYTGSIPSAYITRRGVEYYIKAYDGANAKVIPTTAPATPAIIKVRIPNLPPITTLAENYEMLSIPSELARKNVKSILEDLLGVYDVNAWRLFRWINGAYVELADNANFAFDPGRAYWLITADQKVIAFDTCVSVQTDQNYIMSLDNGWNQVGTPFYFPVECQDIFSSSPGVVQGGVAFEYDGTGWINADIMQPFKGYFVYTPSGGNILRFPPREAGQSLKKSALYSGLMDNEWTLRLETLAGKYHDCDNFAGVRNNADNKYDLYDIFDPPPIDGKFVNIYFDNADWDAHPGRYSGDFKAVTDVGNYYDFTLVAQNTGIPPQLMLKILQPLPDNFELHLIDKDNRISQTVTPDEPIAVNVSKNKINKHYRLIVGNTEFYQENNLGIGLTPQQFALSQNYPNPFNPLTNIRYEIPKISRVSLIVYNTLGQKIRTLVDSEEKYPGYYQAIWNGTNDSGKQVASGIYWYVMRAGEFSQTKKMLFMK